MNTDFDELQRLFDSISENVSKNKGRRGRPPKYTQKDYDPFAELRAQTKRGKQNHIFVGRATSVLRADMEHFAYLLKPKYRTTILAELGRIAAPRLMISVANEICLTRMKTAKAVGLCRRVRGKGSPSISTLTEKIRRTIQAYGVRHPNLSPGDITTALRIVGFDYPGAGQ